MFLKCLHLLILDHAFYVQIISLHFHWYVPLFNTSQNWIGVYMIFRDPKLPSGALLCLSIRPSVPLWQWSISYIPLQLTSSYLIYLCILLTQSEIENQSLFCNICKVWRFWRIKKSVRNLPFLLQHLQYRALEADKDDIFIFKSNEKQSHEPKSVFFHNMFIFHFNLT